MLSESDDDNFEVKSIHPPGPYKPVCSQAAFKERVSEMGGASGVQMQVAANKMKRAAANSGQLARDTALASGQSLKQMLDLDVKTSREPVSSNLCVPH